MTADLDSELRYLNSIPDSEVSSYVFDQHELVVIQFYLQIGKQYLQELCDPKAKEEADKLRLYRQLIELSNGKRGVSKPHVNHDVFTVDDVLEYYKDGSHSIDAQQRHDVDLHFSGMRPSRFYVTLDCMIDTIVREISKGKYGMMTERMRLMYSEYSGKRLRLEIEYAAKRLVVREFATMFPGTPRFKAKSISIDIGTIRSAILKLTQADIPEPKPTPEKGLLHGVVLSPDTPPHVDTSYDCIEHNIDDEISERDRAVSNTDPDFDANHPVARLEDLTIEQRYIVEHAQANHNCVNLQHLLDVALRSPWGKSYSQKTLYMRLYRAAKYLEKFEIISLVKGMESPIFTGIDQNGNSRSWSDGLLWVVLDQSKIHSMTVETASQNCNGGTETDLIKGYYEIPTDVITPKSAKKRRDPYAIPKNCGSLRRSAIMFLQGVHSLDMEENTRDRVEKRHSSGPYHDMRYLMTKFMIYQSESMKKIIALMNTITHEVIGFDYATRFNDYAKGIERLKRYEYAHDMSLKQFKECTFVTLTTDPGKFPNLWKANRHSPIAWNTFMQILTVEPTLGDRKHRLKYIAGFEYTKTGLLHIHTLIFGRRYLHSPKRFEERDWISDKWNNSCGQAKIVEAYGLHNVTCEDGHKEWQWFSREDHPYDAGKMSGGEYLKKYLKKCMMAITDRYQDPSSTLAPYWAENKRFWSCSRSFMPENNDDELSDSGASVKYDFYGMGYGMDVVEAKDAGIIDRIAYKRYDPDRDGIGDTGEVS